MGNSSTPTGGWVVLQPILTLTQFDSVSNQGSRHAYPAAIQARSLQGITPRFVQLSPCDVHIQYFDAHGKPIAPYCELGALHCK